MFLTRLETALSSCKFADEFRMSGQVIVQIRLAVSVSGAAFREQVLLRALNLEIRESERLAIEWDCPEERSALIKLLTDRKGLTSGLVSPPQPSPLHRMLTKLANSHTAAQSVGRELAVFEIGPGTTRLEQRLSTYRNASAVAAFAPRGCRYDRTLFDRILWLKDGRIISMEGTSCDGTNSN